MANLTKIDSEYAIWLSNLKKQVREAQLRAIVSVNSELILLYWQIGREILDRQDKHGWGAKIIEQLATDLKREFPDMSGFSIRNLKHMHTLAEVWRDLEIVQRVAAQLSMMPLNEILNLGLSFTYPNCRYFITNLISSVNRP